MKSKTYPIFILLITGLATWMFLRLQETKLTLDEVITETEFRFYSDEAHENGLGFPPVKLQNGQLRYCPGYSCKYRIEMPYTSGDLDKDGDKDYAILIFNWNGGTGQFLYLTTVLNTNGNPKQSSIISLGDRVQVAQLNITNSVIIIDIIDLRYGDKWQKKYELVNGLLHPSKGAP